MASLLSSALATTPSKLLVKSLVRDFIFLPPLPARALLSIELKHWRRQWASPLDATGTGNNLLFPVPPNYETQNEEKIS